MDWIKINNQADIDELMEKVYGFHDSCIKEICYHTGNYVTDNKRYGI